MVVQKTQTLIICHVHQILVRMNSSCTLSSSNLCSDEEIIFRVKYLEFNAYLPYIFYVCIAAVIEPICNSSALNSSCICNGLDDTQLPTLRHFGRQCPLL